MGNRFEWSCYDFTLYRKCVNKVNSFAWTPLFYAIKQKKESVVQFLLDRGAGTCVYDSYLAVDKLLFIMNIYHKF